MKIPGWKIASLLGRIRPGRRPSRPALLLAGNSLVIVASRERWVVLPEFFRTGGDLAWDPAEKSLVWKTEHGDPRKIPLPAPPDLSALRTGAERKRSGKARWAFGILLLLILPALWVRLFLVPVPGGLSAPARTGIPYAAPPARPGSIDRLSGTGWMK